MTNRQRNFDEDQRICDAATAVPWKYVETTYEYDEIQTGTGETVMYIANYTEEDAVCAAEARTGWPAALGEIRRQAAEIERYRQALESIAEYPPFDETNNGDRFYEQIRNEAKEALGNDEKSDV